MPSFRDKTGDVWTLKLDGPTFARVKQDSEGKFDFADRESVFNQALDLHVCWELLWWIVRPQAIERGVTADDFAHRMAHDGANTLVKARRAFWAAWANYHPSSDPYRAFLRKAIKLEHKEVRAHVARAKQRK